MSACSLYRSIIAYQDFLGMNEAAPRLPVGEQGVASSQRRKTSCRLVPASPSSRRMRQRLILAKEDEAPPSLPRKKMRRHLVPASPSNRRTRQHLVPAKEDEATPHLLAGERGTASSQCRNTRRCLVFQHKNEAAPRPSAGR
ncbi:hypothetical protein GW17_00020784 [Ensete ventricosum]|nr:hypothetical protein GW17_00020784 [Ensete ventricosum]